MTGLLHSLMPTQAHFASPLGGEAGAATSVANTTSAHVRAGEGAGRTHDFGSPPLTPPLSPRGEGEDGRARSAPLVTGGTA